MSDIKQDIIIVVKNKQLQKQLSKQFSDSDYRVTWLTNLDRLLKYFESETYDLLLLSSDVCKKATIEYSDVLNIISKESPQTQILVLAKEGDMDIASQAIEAGGYQYIRIPASDEELQMIIKLALENKPDFGQSRLLLQEETIYRFEGFIGSSPQMQTVYRQIQRVAPTNIHVLLLGETGTGKDLAVQAIHRLSAKKDGHYIPVNLGAYPSDLVSSELFGHEKGAFTGASNQHKGVFETASDGTVFLDEIESIDKKIQLSLLRLIEQKKFTRIGGRRSIHTDARLVAASNENLDELVARGKFRQDLFYRLDVFRITLPSLRQRKGDIPMIAEEFISQFNHELNQNILRIKPECMLALEEYDWPGNVRELKNVLQQAVLYCEDEEITEKHLPPRLQPKSENKPNLVVRVGISLDEVEKRLIKKTLSHTKNNRKKAAELLGITRRALYNKLNKHNIN
jgi:DNA-binding NtrC family response regulator